MAKSWADMSKEERNATGQSKKEYNRSTGQSVIPKYAEKDKEPQPSGNSKTSSGGSSSSKSNPSGQDLINKYTPNAGAASSKSNWQEAKSKAQSHQSSNEGAAAKSAASSRYGENTDWSKLTKSGTVSDEVRNDPRLQEMVKNPKTGAMQNKYVIMYSGGNIVENPNLYDEEAAKKTQEREAQRAAERAPTFNEIQRQERDEERKAYDQYRLDIQAVKAEHGPKGVYGMQSARDTHERSMSRGNPMVTGPQAVESAEMIAANKLAQDLYDTGYDYSHNEMIRHRNAGSDKSKTNSYLYDAYGGYQNWYDNHSLFSGNFTGSKDLMEFDKVMEIGQQQQNAIQNYQTSDEFQNKYGKYDWANNSKYSK